jgi:hypothetical protein
MTSIQQITMTGIGKYKTLIGIWVASLAIISGSCERAAGEQRFIDHGNGTVTDRKLGIMWAKTDNQSDIYWDQIQNWLTREFPGTIPEAYYNWRLPTVAELQSLYVEDPKYNGYETDCGYRVKIVPQIRLSCILIWTSNMALGLPLAFNFNIGNAFSIDLNDNRGCRVLPVRSLQP